MLFVNFYLKDRHVSFKMAYYQLAFGKLKKTPERPIKLKNLHRNCNTEFCLSKLGESDNAFDFDFQWNLISNIRSNEDVQKYLLASGKIGKHMQEDVDLFVTDGKLNNASVRKRFDRLYRNILRRQNP